MMNPPNYAEIKARVDRRVEQQTRIVPWVLFVVNILIFIIFFAIALGIASTPEAQATLAAAEDLSAAIILPFIGWALATAYFGMSLAFSSSKGFLNQMRQQILSREMGSVMYDQLARAAEAEVRGDEGDAAMRLSKPKREGEDRVVEIGDDGELIEVPADYDEPARRTQTR